MADAVIGLSAAADNTRGMRSMVWVTSQIGYLIGIFVGIDLQYYKTTDGGKTWGAAVTLFTGTVDSYDVWYDQWTPGDSGRIIHIAFTEAGTDDVSYLALNTANDVVTSIVDVFAGASTVEGRGTFTSITKARGGNLFVLFNIDAFAETGLYRSTDNGVTWGSRTNPLEANLDQAMLFPANAADPQDIWMIYDDDSTTELTIKTHDDSANTNSESAALTFDNEGTDFTGQYGFSGAIRHSDGHLIFAFFNAFDAAGTDFLVYEWDGTTATALTAITTNIDDMYYPSVYLNQNEPDDIYIGYTGLSDGSQTLRTTASVYYAKSSNRGLTWTKDIAYSSASTDYAQTWCALNGERFSLVFWDISAFDAFGNYDASIDFGFTSLNNYQSPKGTGQNNTGKISIGGIG